MKLLLLGLNKIYKRMSTSFLRVLTCSWKLIEKNNFKNSSKLSFIFDYVHRFIFCSIPRFIWKTVLKAIILYLKYQTCRFFAKNIVPFWKIPDVSQHDISPFPTASSAITVIWCGSKTSVYRQQIFHIKRNPNICRLKHIFSPFAHISRRLAFTKLFTEMLHVVKRNKLS